MDAKVAESTHKRTQAERTAESDQRMLQAAIGLLVEKGTAKTTLKDVGERAGYSRGLASYRFGSKAGLFGFIIRAVGEDWLNELQTAVTDKVGVEAIHAATDAHYRFVSESADRIRAFYLLWFDSIGPQPEMHEVISKVHERRRADVANWIRDGIRSGAIAREVDVAGIADQFCAAIIGIVYQWLATPDENVKIYELHEGLKKQMQLALPAK
ncbi:MAG: TetR/AcrR family transcriptional regulator [Gammaproteobacteria bacterium]